MAKGYPSREKTKFEFRKNETVLYKEFLVGQVAVIEDCAVNCMGGKIGYLPIYKIRLTDGTIKWVGENKLKRI